METGERFDVVVVGAGPSGSSTALHLLGMNPKARVLIVERQELPREKPCGGAISRWGLDALAAVDAGLDRLGVDHVPIRGIRVRYRDDIGERVVDHDGAPLGAVVRRDRFDAALAREAERRGATLWTGARVVELRREDRGFELVLERKATTRADAVDAPRRSVHARFVVGADGTAGTIRRLAAFDDGTPRARLLVLETDAVPSDDVEREDGGIIEFDLTSVDHGVDGYVWHFATRIDGKNKVSRGIYDWRGRRKGDATSLRRLLETMLAARGVDPGTVKLKPYSEHVFAGVDGRLALPEGVLLVGEAAGLVDPVTGEGIAQALVSGEVGARTLRQGLDRGAIDAPAHTAGIRSLHCVGHLRQALMLAPHVYGKRAQTWCAAFAATPSAIDAGVDWYVGERLGLLRKTAVGAALAFRALRSRTRSTRRAE